MVAGLLVIGIAEIAIGLAGIGMMIPSLIPEKPADPTGQTIIRVGAGIYGNSEEVAESDSGGDMPDFALHDKRGEFIGSGTAEGKVDAGGFKDVIIEHDDGTLGRQAEYLRLSAKGDNAICINYITVTWPDGQSWGWLGDVGYMCGADWYHSDVIIANYDSTSTEAPGNLNRTSKCMWIDKNGSNDIRHKALSFHITDFSSSTDPETDERAAQYRDHKDTMCSAPARFRFEGHHPDLWYFWPPLEYTTGNGDADMERAIGINDKQIYKSWEDVDGWGGNWWEKRDAELASHNANETETTKRNSVARSGDTDQEDMRPVRRSSADPVLVKSAREEHSVTELCKAPNSRGPDFVSLSEKVFCDMDRKEVWPLCSDTHPFACFDLDKNTMRPAPHGRRSLNGRDIPDKSYTKEVTWGS